MKKYIFYAIPLVMLVCLSACSDDDDESVSVDLSVSGTMTDNEGISYPTITIGGLEWMAQNLQSGTPWFDQSYTVNGYEYYIGTSNEDEELARIATDGNLLTYEAALELCPEGWRLPTDDDWKCLELALGMSQSEIDKEGWRQGAGLNMASATGMRMPYNGQLTYFSYSVNVYHRGAYGNYWTSTTRTEGGITTVMIRSITATGDMVERVPCNPDERWMSVRYVRDAR